MKWFDQWLQKKIHEAWNTPQKSNTDERTMSIAKASAGISINGLSNRLVGRSELGSRGISFKLHTADGGYVVECSQYDDRSDMHTTNMYLITDEQDLGQRLAHIVTLQALKQ
jgi:hypothetical protein